MSEASVQESLVALLAELHAERERTWEPAALQKNIQQRAQLVQAAENKRFVQTGDLIEDFQLRTLEGGTLSLTQLVANGPAVLVFFRFAGCPACNVAIPYYERNLQPGLQARGVPLVAISPQVPEKLLEIRDRHQLTLQVASDPDNRLGRRLGITFEANEASRQAALAKGRALGEITGTGTWELPQPTALVIGQNRRVSFAEVSPDWLVRSEAPAILQAVDLALEQGTAKETTEDAPLRARGAASF